MKPLESTLRQHELRPYQVQRDYGRELRRSVRGSSKGSARRPNEIKSESMKVISVSPFRAVVKVDSDEEKNDSIESDNEGDFRREQTVYAEVEPGLKNSSPIKIDS